MLWEVDIYPADGQPDRTARQVAADAADLGIAARLTVAAASGYLIQGELSRADADRVARELLADPVVERAWSRPSAHRPSKNRRSLGCASCTCWRNRA